MVLNLRTFFQSDSPPPRKEDRSGNAIIPFVSGRELLEDRNRQIYVARIRSLVSVPDPHFRRLYVSTLENFAEYVQLLPASETHHHAGLGGLLDHSLDVAEKALALRRGYLLPPDADPGVVSRQADLWSFAVFASALCHDIGKAVVDQCIYRFDRNADPLGPWNPWLGPMQDTAYYRVTFVPKRKYGRHELVSPFVARSIIPDAAIEWLGSEREVAAAFVASLSGSKQDSGSLGDIVSQADALSTNENLGVNSTRLPSATQVPLHEKLITALRVLLDNGQVVLNCPGAMGFVTDTDLWLVSKRALDLLRAYLMEQGHGGVPSKNDRLMDELQQFEVCVANDNRAIWRATIELGDWRQELTLLRFKNELVWPNPDNRPPPLSGTVTVDGSSEPPHSTPESAVAIRPLEEQTNHDEAPRLPEFVIPPAEPEVVEELDTGNEAPADPEGKPGKSRADAPAEPDGFLYWLKTGIQSGTFEINTRDSLLHIVPEGLLLVSPRVFKKYAGAKGVEWGYVQARFFKRRLHRRNAQRTNIIRYKIQGKRRASIIKGVLVPDPNHSLGVDLPTIPNRFLELESEL